MFDNEINNLILCLMIDNEISNKIKKLICNDSKIKKCHHLRKKRNL